MTTTDSIHTLDEAMRAQQVAQVQPAASSAPPTLVGETVFLVALTLGLMHWLA